MPRKEIADGDRPEWLCADRDCGTWWKSDESEPRCPECGSPPLV
jgi:rubrerythrin